MNILYIIIQNLIALPYTLRSIIYLKPIPEKVFLPSLICHVPNIKCPHIHTSFLCSLCSAPLIHQSVSVLIIPHCLYYDSKQIWQRKALYFIVCLQESRIFLKFILFYKELAVILTRIKTMWSPQINLRKLESFQYWVFPSMNMVYFSMHLGFT